MDFTKIPLLNMLTKRMGWLQERQSVLSQNVANSDTPGYAARDLKAFDFQRELATASGRIEARRTNPAHLVAATDALRSDNVAKQKYAASPQGNGVVLEEEMLKIADTQMNHTMISNLYKKQVGLLKIALGVSH